MNFDFREFLHFFNLTKSNKVRAPNIGLVKTSRVPNLISRKT